MFWHMFWHLLGNMPGYMYVMFSSKQLLHNLPRHMFGYLFWDMFWHMF